MRPENGREREKIMETLKTERLLLRPWRESDAEDFFEYARDPEVGPNAGWKPHESLEESRKILRSFIEGGEVRALEWKESGKVIGSLGLHGDRIFPERKDSGKELGYVLSREYWGRGLMTEAVKGVLPFVFEEKRLDYLSVAHFAWNMRSKRVIEKCGFRYIETKKGTFTDYRGEKLDEVCYLLTREDYFGEKSSR